MEPEYTGSPNVLLNSFRVLLKIKSISASDSKAGIAGDQGPREAKYSSLSAPSFFRSDIKFIMALSLMIKGNPEEDFPNLVKYADPVARVFR